MEKRHNIDIEIDAPGVKQQARVYIDGMRVEGICDYDVNIPQEGSDPVSVTLKIWPKRFRLSARSVTVNAEAVDLIGGKAIREALNGQ
jgi:hypothetical protein